MNEKFIHSRLLLGLELFLILNPSVFSLFDNLNYLYSMDVQAEKMNFIAWLKEQSDVSLWEELQDVKERYLGNFESEKSKDLKKILDISMKQYEEGHIIDNSVVMEKMNAKYGKFSTP